MPLPVSVARLNKRWTNRFIEPVVARFGGYAVIHHTGRRSGAAYRTPVFRFVQGDAWLVALTYGTASDWVQNVLASGGAIEHREQRFAIEAATVVDRAAAWPALPRTVRLWLRFLRVGDFLHFETSPRDE